MGFGLDVAFDTDCVVYFFDSHFNYSFDRIESNDQSDL